MISVSGREEMRGFHHVFWTRAKQGLIDGHLWLSVVTKPGLSQFTRVQRLTCIIAILFTTMLTNIMNFSSKLDMSEEDDPILLKIGTIRVSNYSLMMGIISSLIALPVNLLIVVIFSKRRLRIKASKEEEYKRYSRKNSDEFNEDIVTRTYAEEDDEEEEEEEEKSRNAYVFILL